MSETTDILITDELVETGAAAGYHAVYEKGKWSSCTHLGMDIVFWHRAIRAALKATAGEIAEQAVSRLTSERDEARAEVERLKGAISELWTDVQQWIQLARRQYDEMPHNSPLCPTWGGIEKSESRLASVAAALSPTAGTRLLEELERLRANNSHWIKQNAELARNQGTDWEEVKAENAAYREWVPRAVEAMKGVQELAATAYQAWDSDQDHKVGKIIAAIAGKMKSYHPQASALSAAIASAPKQKDIP